MKTTDLSLVSVDDLIAELDRRFDHWIFSGMQVGIGKKDQYTTLRKWRGNPATCCGLASQTQMGIYDTYMETQTPGLPPD